MSYSLEFSEAVFATPEDLGHSDAKRLRQAPRPHDSEQLAHFIYRGFTGFRVTQGEYRIIYAIDEKAKAVKVARFCTATGIIESRIRSNLRRAPKRNLFQNRGIAMPSITPVHDLVPSIPAFGSSAPSDARFKIRPPLPLSVPDAIAFGRECSKPAQMFP